MQMQLTLPTDGHLNAHLDDLLEPLDRVLERVRAALPAELPLGVVRVVTVRCDVPIGRSRCVPVAGRRTWWGYRPDRRIPSHLAAGEPALVSTLTAWVRRASDDRIDLLTVYPGEPAPKERHDPSLTDAERPEAEAFWAAHALIAPEPARIVQMEGVGLEALASGAAGEPRSLRVRRVPPAHAHVLAQAASPSDGSPLAAGDAVLVGRPLVGDWFWVEVG